MPQTVSAPWCEKEKPHWSESRIKRIGWLFERNLFPWLGHRPMAEITPPELLAVLRRTESKGTIETAHRAKQVGLSCRLDRTPTGAYGKRCQWQSV